MTASSLNAFASGGAYGSLQKYLAGRYADSIVLTFREIEDLLGFALPDPARVESEWWGAATPGSSPSPQWQSWTLAKRHATANLSAETVLFERMPTGRPSQ
jgi:hypothetical protein